MWLPMELGIRELKNGLSSALRRVAAGEVILVTDRGVPVARVVPVGGHPPLPRHIQALRDREQLELRSPRRGQRRGAIKIKPGEKTAADYVSEQRR